VVGVLLEQLTRMDCCYRTLHWETRRERRGATFSPASPSEIQAFRKLGLGGSVWGQLLKIKQAEAAS
jgi:hypothetical protein